MMFDTLQFVSASKAREDANGLTNTSEPRLVTSFHNRSRRQQPPHRVDLKQSRHVIDSCHRQWHSPDLGRSFQGSLLFVLSETAKVCRDSISTESPSNVVEWVDPSQVAPSVWVNACLRTD